MLRKQRDRYVAQLFFAVTSLSLSISFLFLFWRVHLSRKDMGYKTLRHDQPNSGYNRTGVAIIRCT